MKLGIAGMALVLLSTALLALAWLYYDFSIWLVVPGALFFITGGAMTSAFVEQVIRRVSSTKHKAENGQQGKEAAAMHLKHFFDRTAGA